MWAENDTGILQFALGMAINVRLLPKLSKHRRRLQLRLMAS